MVTEYRPDAANRAGNPPADTPVVPRAVTQRAA